MNNLYHLFNSDELEELNAYKGFTKNLSSDGKRIVCFELLYRLIYDEKELPTVPREELLSCIEQLLDFRSVLLSMFRCGVDTSSLDTIIAKSTEIFHNEINRRDKSLDN